MKLKTLIVGCGKIADGHVGEIRNMDNADVVGVCDLEILMAEQLARRFGVPEHFDDMAEAIEKTTPDVVHITTPPQAHLKLATQAIDAGCHVYVEKPLTMNLAETEALLEHAESNGRKVTVGHSFAFDPPALAMRELVSAGVLGDPVHVESYFGYNLAGPFGAAILADASHWVHHLPGKLFHNNIDHMLNKMTEFVPDERPEVHAMGFKRRPESFGDPRDELLDELRVLVRGEQVTGYATFTSHVSPMAQFARIYGTKNIIHVDYGVRTVTVEQGTRLPSALGRLLPAFGRGWTYHREGWKNVFRFARSRFHFFAGMHNLIAAFYDSLQNDTDVPISHAEMRRMSWLLDEIFEQLEAQRQAGREVTS